jgi:hypothetical protein
MKLELVNRYFCKDSTIINRELFRATGEGLKGLLVRRINAVVDRNGFFDAACEPAIWQEQIHTGEFHNMNGFFSLVLEKAHRAHSAPNSVFLTK